MLPNLMNTIEVEDLTFWQTNDGKVGTGFEIDHCDLEMESPEEYSKKLTALIKKLNPNILGRIHFKCFSSNDNKSNTSRAESVAELGYKNNRVFFYVNHLGNSFDVKNLRNLFFPKSDYSQELESLLELRRNIENFGFSIRPLSPKAVSELFQFDYDLIKTTKSVETSFDSVGVIRLVRQAADEINHFSLSDNLNSIENYEISVSFRRLSESHTKLILEKRLKQLSSQKDVSSKLQSVETEDSIKNQFSKGTQLVEFEFLVILRRLSQAELAKDISKAISELNKFSDFKIETFGVAESFIATHPTSNQHVPLLESDSTLPAFLPLFHKSENRSTPHERSLTLYRDNQTLSHFDLFDSSFNCFNALIVGTSGKGKSVLTGLLTRSLLNDPNIQIIKVDVGGSHSKECELYDGTEYRMKLDEPSGINPFLVLDTKASDSEKNGILSKFLSVLILEIGEVQFSKDIKSDIESAIQDYINFKPKSPDLNDFYNFASHFPRRNLLKRWVSGGIYESAFKRTGQEKLCNTQLRYYNFAQVFQASDPEFAQAGIAAVLAQFNIDSITTNGKRLVLICDETVFFIKSCFDFFKLTTSNVRKYGHSVVLISQLSTDFIVNGDLGIVENSPQRFLFNIDGRPKDFQERLSLTNEHLKTIEKLNSVPKVHSEVFLQTGTIGKKLRIKITPEEYWALTTSQPDQLKIQKLRAAVPGLSLKEALKCLSIA